MQQSDWEGKVFLATVPNAGYSHQFSHFLPPPSVHYVIENKQQVHCFSNQFFLSSTTVALKFADRREETLISRQESFALQVLQCRTKPLDWDTKVPCWRSSLGNRAPLARANGLSDLTGAWKLSLQIFSPEACRRLPMVPTPTLEDGSAFTLANVLWHGSLACTLLQKCLQGC